MSSHINPPMASLTCDFSVVENQSAKEKCLGFENKHYKNYIADSKENYSI